MSFKELNSIAYCREVYTGLKSRLMKISGELARSRLNVTMGPTFNGRRGRCHRKSGCHLKMAFPGSDNGEKLGGNT